MKRKKIVMVQCMCFLAFTFPSLAYAADFQKMTLQERVDYVNNFKEEIALMKMQDREKAVENLRIKMHIKTLVGQSKEFVQQMQMHTQNDMNLVKNMFQRESDSLRQATQNATRETNQDIFLPLF